jgi:hypothetical protein
VESRQTLTFLQKTQRSGGGPNTRTPERFFVSAIHRAIDGFGRGEKASACVNRFS